MALNPPMLALGIPMAIAGESYLLQRAGVGLELDAPGKKIKANGTVYVTSVRMCLVFDKQQDDVISLDVPIQGLKGDPDFKQPIFGANRLETRVTPVPGRGLDNTGEVGIKITFVNGGAGTFLRVLFTLIEQYRQADFASRQAFLSPPRMQSYISSLMGLRDPSDPSTLYLQQPAQTQTWAGYSPGTVAGRPAYADFPVPVATPVGIPQGVPAVNPAYLAAVQGGQQQHAQPPSIGYGAPQPSAGPQGYGYGMPTQTGYPPQAIPPQAVQGMPGQQGYPPMQTQYSAQGGHPQQNAPQGYGQGY